MKYWTEKVSRLEPYDAGPVPRGPGWIKLDQNENPYPPSKLFLRGMRAVQVSSLRLYPSSLSDDVRSAALAQLHRIGLKSLNADNIFVSNSSDEVLAHSYTAFLSGRTNVMMPDISYGFYPLFATMFDVGIRTVALRKDLSISPGDYSGASGVVIANPNAPTGLALRLHDIEAIVRQNPKGVVIIDEAYIDFANVPSAVHLVPKYDNLLIVRTLSKSYSMAGLRVGYAIGAANLIEALRCVQNSFNPYPLGTFEQVAAAWTLRDIRRHKEQCNRIIQTRDKYNHEFRKLGYEPTRSQTSFLFVKIGPNAKELYKHLIKNKILVRYQNAPRIYAYLRVSVGTEDQMKRLLSCVRDFRKHRD